MKQEYCERFEYLRNTSEILCEGEKIFCSVLNGECPYKNEGKFLQKWNKRFYVECKSKGLKEVPHKIIPNLSSNSSLEKRI